MRVCAQWCGLACVVGRRASSRFASACDLGATSVAAFGLDDRVLSGGLAEPLGAQLRRALECVEVDVDEAEAVAVERRGDRLQLLVGKGRRAAARLGEVLV